MRKPTTFVFVLLALFGLIAAGCGNDSSTPGNVTTTTVGTVATTAAEASPTAVPVSGDITVLAAASLTDVFKELGTAFETANPETTVTFSFGASSALATQITEGAPADIYASADLSNMAKLTKDGGAGTESVPVTFATNKLQIITGAGNPKAIATLADLAKSDVVYLTASPEVPIGKYAKQALDQAQVTVTPKSLETDVKAIVTKVTLGEADAGIVYATDVKAAGDKATGVTIPDDVNVLATYPIATIKEAKNVPTSHAFIAFVTGADGQAILAKYGFSKP